MLLYDSPVSGNCYKVRLLLAHLGIPYERRTMDVVDRSDRPDVLSALNPALRVPTLVFDDGRSLGESNAIIWYLADGTPWIPDDPFERAQVLQWQFFEQYDHEPNIAVARFMLMVSGEPERYAAELPAQAGRRLPGARRDGAPPRRTCVPRRRLPHARRHLAVRLHARGRRGRARHERLPGDRRVARQDRRAAGTRGDHYLGPVSVGIVDGWRVASKRGQRASRRCSSCCRNAERRSLVPRQLDARQTPRGLLRRALRRLHCTCERDAEHTSRRRVDDAARRRRATTTSLRRFLHGLPGVDQVGAEARAAGLATRSIKTTSKAWAIDTAIRMVDLTTLEGADTPARCARCAPRRCGPTRATRRCPPVAAVCVYPDLVETAVEALRGSGVQVASVATAFPSGRASLATKLADVRDAVAAGADEIDMVIDRGAFLAGRYGQVFDEIVATRAACGAAHLKVILETGELVTLDNVRRASLLALLAGGDFIKTSTGKVSPGRDAAGRARHAGGGARLRRRDRRRPRREAGRRHPHEQGGGPLPRDGQRGRRRRAGSIPTCSASAPRACSTTCCCSGTSSRPAPTTAPTT